MFTASSSRAAVVERLRRVLFSPSKLLTAGALAGVLICGSVAVAQDPFIFTHKPTAEDATNMVLVSDGNEIPTYGKSYGADAIEWKDETQITVGGLYHRALEENGKLALTKASDLSDEDRANLQRYQLVYVYKGKNAENKPEIAGFNDEKLLDAAAYAQLPAENKASYEAYYVEYEIDPATGLRKLYSETDVQNAEAAEKPVGVYADMFNDSVYLSSVQYNKALDSKALARQAIVKNGGGRAIVAIEAADKSHNVDKITVNGGVLEFKGAVDLSGAGESVVKSQSYGGVGQLHFNNAATVGAKAVLTNVDGFVYFGDEAQIDGAYVSQNVDSKLKDVSDSATVTTKFNGPTTVAGQLVVADAGFNDALTLQDGSKSYLYGETLFSGGGAVVVEEGATVYAGTRNLDVPGSPVTINGDVIFTNLNEQDSDGVKATSVEVKRDEYGELVLDENGQITVELVANEAYAPWDEYQGVVTYDEESRATELTVDNTYVKMMETIRETEARGDWKDAVNSASFLGGGTIVVEAQTAIPAELLENNYVQTDFFTIFDGDKSGFTGDTNVKRGALVFTAASYNDVLEGKTAQSYGQTGSGVFTVSGVSLGSNASTNGRLVLWRDTLNGQLDPNGEGDAYAQSLETAPILSGNKFEFQGFVDNDGATKHAKGSGLGAQLVFNAAFTFENDAMTEGSGYVKDTTVEYKEKYENLWTDVQSDRVLATLNANEIAFSESNYLWYDDVSRLDAGADMKLNLNASTIKVYTDDVANRFGDSASLVSDIDPSKGNYYVVNGNNREQTAAIQDLFYKPLVDAQVNVANQTGDDGVETFKGYEVVMNARDVADFADNYSSDKFPTGLNANAKKAAQELDELRASATLTSKDNYNHVFCEALYNEDNADKIAQTLHNVGLIGFTSPNWFNHPGNPSSIFFAGAGSAISAEAKRGQEEQNDDPNPNRKDPSAINEEEETEEAGPTRGLWASFTHTTVQGKSYEADGLVPGYDLARSGIMGGVKRQYDATTSGGLFFALTAPEIDSTANIGGGYMREAMEMTDFQFAGHIEKVIADNWELCLFAGGGMQKMNWERTVALKNDKQHQYTSTGDGNTLTGTAYLAYRYDIDDNWTIRPMIGIDSEHSWLYAFEERGAAAEMSAGYLHTQLLTQAYRFDQTYYNRNLARAGFTLAYDGSGGWAGFSGRAFYSTQLGGKPAPLISFSSVAGEDNVVSLSPEDFQAHVMGSDAFSVGGGGYLHLNQAKTLTANGDVNAIWYKHASTLNVTGGVSYRF